MKNLRKDSVEPEKKQGKSLFSAIDQVFKTDKIFGDGIPVQYLPHVGFFTLIAILYIANAHYAEKTVRRIDKLKIEVEDLRADYTTQKAEYMYASKQSEVAKKVAQMGLKESMEPPYKIIKKD
ncbi:MAG: hypothetical protein K2Q22_17520 [Cytophagales bacterium]|nr:hypothetical protein [Cytophagales bacterium]